MQLIRILVGAVLFLVGLFFVAGGFYTMGDETGIAPSVIMIIIGLIPWALMLKLLKMGQKNKQQTLKRERELILEQTSIQSQQAKVDRAVEVKQETETEPEAEENILLSSTSEISNDIGTLKKQIIDPLHDDTVWDNYEQIKSRVNVIASRAVEFNDLTPQELFFLNQVNGLDINVRHEYWYKECGVDSISAAQAYIEKGYTELIPLDPWNLTVEQNKDLLRAKKQKLSGIKEDLVDRVLECYSDDELRELNPEKRIQLTQKGVEAVTNTPYSLLRNYIVERDCLLLIFQGKYLEAQEKACSYRSTMPEYTSSNKTYFEHEAIERLRKITAFKNAEDNAIYIALCILRFLAFGTLQPVTTRYVEAWIPDHKNWILNIELDDAFREAVGDYEPPREPDIDLNPIITKAILDKISKQ